MHLSRSVRILILFCGVASVFVLPWVFSIAAMFLAGLVFPPAAFLIGCLSDVLYYPGHGLPWGMVAGLATALVATFVRYFVKTRIM